MAQQKGMKRAAKVLKRKQRVERETREKNLKRLASGHQPQGHSHDHDHDHDHDHEQEGKKKKD